VHTRGMLPFGVKLDERNSNAIATPP